MQRAAFPFEINSDLVNAVRVALYLEYSEDEIYKLSEIREPRRNRPNGSMVSEQTLVESSVIRSFYFGSGV